MEAYKPLIEQVVSEADAYFERQGRYVDPTLHEISGPTRVILIVRDDVPVADIAKHMLACRVTPSMGNFYLALGVATPKNIESLLSVDGVVMALRDVNLGEEMGITFDTTPEELKEHTLWPGKDVNLPPKPDDYETMSSDLKPKPNMWNAL